MSEFVLLLWLNSRVVGGVWEGAARRRILILELEPELPISKSIHEWLNMDGRTCLLVLATANAGNLSAAGINFPIYRLRKSYVW